jgi:hypothetical protein
MDASMHGTAVGGESLLELPHSAASALDKVIENI